MDDDLLPEILDHMQKSGMSARAFGLAAANDSTLVPDLKAGRELRRKTVARIRNFIAQNAAINDQKAG